MQTVTHEAVQLYAKNLKTGHKPGPISVHSTLNLQRQAKRNEAAPEPVWIKFSHLMCKMPAIRVQLGLAIRNLYIYAECAAASSRNTQKSI